MNRIAYTAFVAFLSSVLTLLSVYALSSEDERVTVRDGVREITLEELAEHDRAESCWKAIHGEVFDLTDYIPDHPTSEAVIVEWCGRESTYGWDNKRPGVPHSPRAAALLEAYRIGVLVGESEASAPTRDADTGATASMEESAVQERVVREGPVSPAMGDDTRLFQALLGLAPGTHLDGRYRGIFADRGEMQVNVQFELRDGLIHDLRYRHLAHRGIDYLTLAEGDALYPVLVQHRWIGDALEDRPLHAIFALHGPDALIDDLDGFSGATLPGNKVLSAIRDGLNRGVYEWP